MKTNIFIFCATVLIIACNNSPKATDPTTAEAIETTQQEKDSVRFAVLEKPSADKPTEKKNIQKLSASRGHSAVSGSGSVYSESDNTAKTKKGWSKTAKGAVIGGVAGAGTGAVVNKKNRTAGAVVGGVVGAGVGAAIGHEMDKKDGRH
ncbi:MAG: glycine zipper domain-containing protein [Bacteroidota bacterium]|nr:glycine zipper domain-containing protein [Bacteroidota bacterium]